MVADAIAFNRPCITGKEREYLSRVLSSHRLAGDGEFTRLCHQWLEQSTGCNKALLTHSCTAALEMAALLLNVKPGDEVIMPSYTFVSTANAFVLRGAVPVFVDIRQDTLNLDEALIEAAITPRTRAIVPVHYAGVACNMDRIMAIARKHGLTVIEDAAQGIMASYKGRALGSIGDIGTYSFHETKNLVSGEGGCLLINDPTLSERAEIIREKGTDRSRFFRGEVDKYTWQEAGSSFLPGELIAACLWAQFEAAKTITQARLKAWNNYHTLLEPLEQSGLLRRPTVPKYCQHNAHLYYVLLSPGINRQTVLDTFRKKQIGSAFHYIPLHSSPAGKKYGKQHGELSITNAASAQLMRLPLWADIPRSQQDAVVEALHKSTVC